VATVKIIARAATAFSVLAAFLAGCDLAVRAPWCWPAAEAGAAVILAATSTWIRHANPNIDDKDTR
jgi:hypothetical protein